MLKNPEENIVGSIDVFGDITDHKQAEEKREVLDIKSEFISNISHELRTPLTVIEGCITAVLDGVGGEINEEQKKLLDAAKRNINILDRLVNDLLDFRKLESGKMKLAIQENDINEVVREVHQAMLPSVKGGGLDFSLNLEDNLPKARCDRDKIKQVITNLVSNAAKFTETGNIIIATSRGDNVVQVSVSDTGCGISKKDLRRIFDEFEKSKRDGGITKRGTGLGLAISKGIIEQHKGKICAESEHGKGATFHFVLPIEERRNTSRKEL